MELIAWMSLAVALLVVITRVPKLFSLSRQPP